MDVTASSNSGSRNSSVHRGHRTKRPPGDDGAFPVIPQWGHFIFMAAPPVIDSQPIPLLILLICLIICTLLPGHTSPLVGRHMLCKPVDLFLF